MTGLDELMKRMRNGKDVLPPPAADRPELCIKMIEQFAEFLTARARQVYQTSMPAMVHTFPRKEGGSWRKIECQFLGMVIRPKGGELAPEHVKILADKFNMAIERGLVGWGVLAPAVHMPLPDDGKGRRRMLLVYTYSEFTRDELNEKLEGDFFVEEGGIPPEID